LSPVVRLILIDDHPMVRDGLASVLAAEPGFEVVGRYGNGADALTNLHLDQPDVALVDLRLPDADGVEVLTALVSRRPTLRALILSSHEGDAAVARALKAGAAGYILKRQPTRELIAAVRASLHGPVPMAPELTATLIARRDESALTSREVEVLSRIAAGMSNKTIGDELGISHNTVKNHIMSLMLKLQASDRTQAVTIALQRGIISFDEGSDGKRRDQG